MLTGEIHDLRHLCFCDFIGVHPAFPHPMVVNMQHDSSRFFPILLEETFHDMNHELHWRVVIVEQQHPIKIRTLGNRFCPGNDDRSRPVSTVAKISPACHFQAHYPQPHELRIAYQRLRPSESLKRD